MNANPAHLQPATGPTAEPRLFRRRPKLLVAGPSLASLREVFPSKDVRDRAVFKYRPDRLSNYLGDR